MFVALKMPLEGEFLDSPKGSPITFSVRTNHYADLRLTPAESILVPASVVGCSDCSERNEDAARSTMLVNGYSAVLLVQILGCACEA